MQTVEWRVPKVSMMETEALKETLMGEVSCFDRRVCNHDTLNGIESEIRRCFVEFFQNRGTAVDTMLSAAIDMISLNKMLFYQFGMISVEAPYIFHEIFSGLSSKEVPIVMKWQEDIEDALF